MRILITGASSFTGAWFARELAAAGHEVTAVFRRRPEEYPDELRRKRAAWAASACHAVYGPSFGAPEFLDLIRQGRFELLAHHAAEVTNYKSPDFDAVGALAGNARNLQATLAAYGEAGGRKVLLTGSVFEGGEGAGSQGLPHFSAYGLSKALTWEVFRYACERGGFSLGKFVIANPFGPWEEARYTAYLMKNWLAGTTPSCANPLYVRDNIHVSLMARAYVAFAESLPGGPGVFRLNPTGYVESQGAFTLRLAEAMRLRLGLPCPVELKRQTDFPEPRVRINTDVLDPARLNWDEGAAWDAMASWYKQGGGR